MLLAVTAVALPGCSSSPVGPRDGGADAGGPAPDAGPVLDAGWSLVSTPATDDLCCVRTPDSNTVLIAGGRTLVIRTFSQWTPILGLCDPNGTDAGVQALWATSESDVWVGLGTQKQSVCNLLNNLWSVVNVGDNRSVNALWGTSHYDIWGADDAPGYLGHSDGVTWSHTGPNVQSAALWGSGPNDVWSAGPGGIDHWPGLDAGTVTLDSLGAPSAQPLHGIWGSSPTDVWAVGVGGTVMHRNSVGWSMPATAPTTSTLYGVWGSGPSDVWAVGDQGTILHFDGNAWTPALSPTTATLRSIWGTSATNVWAAGDRGTVLHLGP